MEDHYANIQDFQRKQRLVLRQQLEYLQAEGCISPDDFIHILEDHPLTLSSEKMVIKAPQRNPEYVSLAMSYTEACASLIKRVLDRISDFQKVSNELDPKGMGSIQREDFNKLSLDLLIAILLTRNQSLQRYFASPIVDSLGKKCESILAMCYGEDVVELYNQLNRTWIESIKLSDIPQIEVGNILVDRMRKRLPNMEWIDPFLPTGIGEMLVFTECFYWRIVSMCAILKED